MCVLNNITWIEQATLMVMQFGQFLDHDITLTPEGHTTKHCCSEQALAGGFPDRCFPIAVPCEDPTFSTLQGLQDFEQLQELQQSKRGKRSLMGSCSINDDVMDGLV